jgi:hypothetical protein
MRRVCLIILLLLCGMAAVTADTNETGKIIKVLPQYLDGKGQNCPSPSLFERDAYQVWLRQHPEARSGIRYEVQWKAWAAKHPLKLRIELRGIAHGNLPMEKTLELEVNAGLGASRWSSVALTGESYKKFGEVTAWRVTLWDGPRLLSEQKSFLW